MSEKPLRISFMFHQQKLEVCAPLRSSFPASSLSGGAAMKRESARRRTRPGLLYRARISRLLPSNTASRRPSRSRLVARLCGSCSAVG